MISSRARARSGVSAAGNDQGDEEGEDDGLGDFGFEIAHGGGGEHFAEEEDDEPDGAFADERHDGSFGVGGVEGFDTAEFLHVLCGGLFGDVEDVVDGDDAHEPFVGIEDGESGAVVTAEEFDGGAFFITGAEGDEAGIHQFINGSLRRGEEQLAGSDIIDEAVIFIDDVDDVQGFAVLAVTSNVIEDVLDGPVGVDGDEVGGHEAADGIGRVLQQGFGEDPLF